MAREEGSWAHPKWGHRDVRDILEVLDVQNRCQAMRGLSTQALINRGADLLTMLAYVDRRPDDENVPWALPPRIVLDDVINVIHRWSRNDQEYHELKHAWGLPRTVMVLVARILCQEPAEAMIYKNPRGDILYTMARVFSGTTVVYDESAVGVAVRAHGYVADQMDDQFGSSWAIEFLRLPEGKEEGTREAMAFDRLTKAEQLRIAHALDTYRKGWRPAGSVTEHGGIPAVLEQYANAQDVCYSLRIMVKEKKRTASRRRTVELMQKLGCMEEAEEAVEEKQPVQAELPEWLQQPQTSQQFTPQEERAIAWMLDMGWYTSIEDATAHILRMRARGVTTYGLGDLITERVSGPSLFDLPSWRT